MEMNDLDKLFFEVFGTDETYSDLTMDMFLKIRSMFDGPVEYLKIKMLEGSARVLDIKTTLAHTPKGPRYDPFFKSVHKYCLEHNFIPHNITVEQLKMYYGKYLIKREEDLDNSFILE